MKSPKSHSYMSFKETDLDGQISMEAQSVASRLNSSGLLRSQGLIGGKWTEAYDAKTLKVHPCSFYI